MDDKKQSKLAVLRKICGLSQKEFAKLVRRSVFTIRALEQGRLKLSENLAMKIGTETGVNITWLLEGDVQTPPVPDMSSQKEFTKEYFEKVRSGQYRGYSLEAHELSPPWADSERFDSIQEAAVRSNRGRLFRYRVKKFLDELAAEFGGGKISDKRIREIANRDLLQQKFEFLFMDPDFRHRGERRDPRPPWSFYKEFVPTFIETLDQLVEVFNARIKEHGPDFQEPGLYPLLAWAWEAVPPHPHLHPLLLKKYEELRKELSKDPKESGESDSKRP
jgi:DNA-binding XRE family transcriptional regulator